MPDSEAQIFPGILRRGQTGCGKGIVVKGTAFSPYINLIADRPLGPEGGFLGLKKRPQGLKPTVFDSAGYGLKPVPCVRQVFRSA